MRQAFGDLAIQSKQPAAENEGGEQEGSERREKKAGEPSALAKAQFLKTESASEHGIDIRERRGISPAWEFSRRDKLLIKGALRNGEG